MYHPLHLLPAFHDTAVAPFAAAILSTSSSDIHIAMTCVSPEAAAALQEALAQTTNHFRYVLVGIHIRQLFTSFFYRLQQRNCAFSSEPLPSSIIYREHIECVSPFLAFGNYFACQSSPSLHRVSGSCALQLSSSRVSMVTRYFTPVFHRIEILQHFFSLRRCDAAQAEMLMSRDYLATNDCRGSLNALLKLLNTRYARDKMVCLFSDISWCAKIDFVIIRSCDVVESYAFKLQQRNITRTR